MWYLGGFINQPMIFCLFFRGTWLMTGGLYHPTNVWCFIKTIEGFANWWEQLEWNLSKVPKVRLLLWKWALQLGWTAEAPGAKWSWDRSWVLVFVYFDEKHWKTIKTQYAYKFWFSWICWSCLILTKSTTWGICGEYVVCFEGSKRTSTFPRTNLPSSFPDWRPFPAVNGWRAEVPSGLRQTWC